MEISLWISSLALLLSIGSLALSFHIGYRDRSKLKATSTLYNPTDGYCYMRIKAVNHGRRPVILTMLGADFGNGSWQGSYLKNNPHRLGENEAFEQNFTAEDKHVITHEGEEHEVIDLWFKDTLGRRYVVKNARKHLKKL